VNHWLKSFRDAVIGLAFPQMCVLCAAPIESLDDGVTCAACWQNMPRAMSEHRCARCGLPQYAQRRSADLLSPCSQCREAAFTLLRFVGPYDGALRENLLFLKHHPHICQRTRAMIMETYQREDKLHSATRVMPVPLHPLRRKERGFNQAELIAQIIARQAKIAFDRQTIIRIKHTERHRAGMDARARAKSLAAAFAIRRPEHIRNQAVLLVDDVFTTGATLNACSQALLEAGARAVYGFAVARVVGESLVAGRAKVAGGPA
jgi:ComF family protein